MVTNTYFNNYDKKDTGFIPVVQSLVTETIQIYGQDLQYIKRESIGEDALWGEDRDALFEHAYTIEMYLDNPNSYEGEGNLITQFGIFIKDSANLVVSKPRFKEAVGIDAPKVADLIYHPLTNSLFEIISVDTRNPFFQFGKFYTFNIKVELFSYSHETFETGVANIDKLNDEFNIVIDEPITIEPETYRDNTVIETTKTQYVDATKTNPLGNI